MRTILSGRGLLESPRWNAGQLVVSDWTAGEVLAVDLEGGPPEVLATLLPSLPLCTAFDPEGRIVVVDTTAGRLLRTHPGEPLEPWADLGRPGWNDIVVDGRGNAFVNRPDFGPAHDGTVVVATPDGTVSEVATGLDFPNGMAVTADDATLLVGDSHAHRIMAYAIAADGRLDGGRVWAELGEGTPDGICIDAEGAVWFADVPNRWCRRVAEGGEVLATVELDRSGFACVLGGTTLYVAAATWQGMETDEWVAPGSGEVFAVPVDVPGAGRP